MFVTSFLIHHLQESPMPDPSELFTNVYVKGFGVEVNEFLQIHCLSFSTFSLKRKSFNSVFILDFFDFFP